MSQKGRPKEKKYGGNTIFFQRTARRFVMWKGLEMLRVRDTI